MREPAGRFQLLQCQLGAFIPRVEPLCAEVDRIGTVGYGGAYCVKGSRRGKKLRNRPGYLHTSIYPRSRSV